MSANEVYWLERLVSEMTGYVLSARYNSTPVVVIQFK